MIPLCFDWGHYDLSYLTRVYYTMASRESVSIIESEVNFVMLVERLSRKLFALVERFHGVVACMMAGTPFIVTSPSPKLEHFCRDNGLEASLISAHELSAEEIVAAVERVLEPSWVLKLQNALERNVEDINIEKARIRGAIRFLMERPDT